MGGKLCKCYNTCQNKGAPFVKECVGCHFQGLFLKVAQINLLRATPHSQHGGGHSRTPVEREIFDDSTSQRCEINILPVGLVIILGTAIA